MERMFSHLNQDGENMSFHPSCYYQSPKHQVIEAADIKYVRYGYIHIGIVFTYRECVSVPHLV